MNFKATIVLEYNVPDDQLSTDYGTNDPYACEKIDEKNFLDEENLIEMLSHVDISTVKVEAQI